MKILHKMAAMFKVERDDTYMSVYQKGLTG